MKKIILTITILTALIAGCYKDKGNYTLSPINVLTLSGSMPDTIVMLQMDTLTISGKVDQSIPVPESQLKFQWKLFPYANAGYYVDLGTTKDVKAAIKVNPGNYRLLFSAIDTKTNVPYFKEFYVQVNSILSEGWLVLEDRSDGNPDIAIIQPTGLMFHDLYRQANDGEKLPTDAYSVKVLNTITAQNVFVLAQTDGIELDYAGFKKFGNAGSWFFQTPPVIKPQGYFYTKLGVTAFFVNDGDLHSYAFYYSGPVKLGAPFKGNWRISGFGMPGFSSDDAYLYDDLNQRFLVHKNNTLNTFATQAGAAWDMNNVGKQMIYAGVSTGDYYNCIMKNNGEEKYFVYRVLINGAIPAAETYTVDNAPGFSTGRFFQSSGLYNHIYYVSGSNVYLLDVPARTARLVYSFPAGTEITALRLKQSQSNLLFVYPDDNRTMMVATYEGGEGKVYSFSVNNTGDFINNTYTKVYTGFGKIRHLEYKNRKL